MYRSNNLPHSLQPVIEAWDRQHMEFYIGPENMFFYNGNKINYLANPDIPLAKGSWYAASENFQSGQIPALSRRQIEDVAIRLAGYLRPHRWSIFLNYRCNYECPMCPYHGGGYEDTSAGDYWRERAAQKRIVPKEEAFQLIDTLAQNGITLLHLGSYGEILLYPHWAEVADYAYHKGMTLGLITNGVLVTEEIAGRLRETGVTNIRVSLDALSFDVYSKVRCARPPHFEAARNAPHLLKKYGRQVNVHFVVQKENAHEKNAFLEYWQTTDVDSISFAKQLIFHDGNSTTWEAMTKDDFIHGTCSKYGNFASLNDGSVTACCEIIGLYKDRDSHGLPRVDLLKSSFENCTRPFIDLMAKRDNPMMDICRNCPLYTFVVTEEDQGDWIVRRTSERETWIRKNR